VARKIGEPRLGRSRAQHKHDRPTDRLYPNESRCWVKEAGVARRLPGKTVSPSDTSRPRSVIMRNAAAGVSRLTSQTRAVADGERDPLLNGLRFRYAGRSVLAELTVSPAQATAGMTVAPCLVMAQLRWRWRRRRQFRRPLPRIGVGARRVSSGTPLPFPLMRSVAGTIESKQ
jgi:hypothetical protein